MSSTFLKIGSPRSQLGYDFYILLSIFRNARYAQEICWDYLTLMGRTAEKDLVRPIKEPTETVCYKFRECSVAQWNLYGRLINERGWIFKKNRRFRHK